MSTAKYAIKYLTENPLRVYKFILYALYKFSKTNPVQTVNGVKMVLDLDAHVDRNLFFYGKVDVDLEKFITTCVKEGDVFFDIGANSGYFSLLSAKKVKKYGSVHAFEPVPGTFLNFKKSIKQNRFGNIYANNFCIGDFNGKTEFNVSFSSDVSGMRTTSYQTGIKKITIPVRTLSRYVKENKSKKINFIKIDTEGAEFAIITSSLPTLKALEPILIVEFSNKTAKAYGHHPTEIYKLLTKAGYVLCRYKNGKFVKQKMKKTYEENLYCIPRNKINQYLK